ncbi:MAG: WG repeat-containing protein [Chitinophagales bacterium]|nr:WG repeat-containing protein [Chitinophagales bacterium]
MKIFILFLMAVLNCLSLFGQTLSQKDLLELASCTDFDCFASSVLSKGISQKENPYNDAFGGKHQIVFNPNYELPNIEVYSVGITFKDEFTTLFLRSKNIEYQSKLIGELLVWGDFENIALNQTDGGTTFSSYKSKKYEKYTLRTEEFYDNDDKCNYYVVKLTKPTKNNEQPKYNLKFSSGEGLFTVESNRKRGFIDSSDKVIIPLIYDMATNFEEGLANVRLNEKWGFIDKTGKEVIPFIYEDAYGFSEGLAKVKLNGKVGFIDKTGKEIIPCKYERAGTFFYGLADVKLNGKWGLIDQTGKEIVVPKYDEIEIYKGFPAMVVLNHKCGFIDKTGKEIIPLKYDAVSSFKQGLTDA